MAYHPTNKTLYYAFHKINKEVFDNGLEQPSAWMGVADLHWVAMDILKKNKKREHLENARRDNVMTTTEYEKHKIEIEDSFNNHPDVVRIREEYERNMNITAMK